MTPTTGLLKLWTGRSLLGVPLLGALLLDRVALLEADDSGLHEQVARWAAAHGLQLSRLDAGALPPDDEQPALVLLAAALPRPVTLARQLRNHWKTAQILFLSEDGEADALHRALGPAPARAPLVHRPTWVPIHNSSSIRRWPACGDGRVCGPRWTGPMPRCTAVSRAGGRCQRRSSICITSSMPRAMRSSASTGPARCSTGVPARPSCSALRAPRCWVVPRVVCRSGARSWARRWHARWTATRRRRCSTRTPSAAAPWRSSWPRSVRRMVPWWALP